MDLLEHPFEAVAFRLYSLPEASAATGAAAWTCLAAVLAAAAAAGLWRLRASSAPTAVATAATKPLELDPAPADEAPTAPSCASEPAAAPSPKERYTAYYRDPCRVGCCDDAGDEYARGDDDREDEAEEHDDAGAYRTRSKTTTGPFGWDEVVRSLPLSLSPSAAKVEMGLGPYRSPTALGGSVVQLWDQVAGGGLTPTSSPRWRNRVAAAAPGF
ncbi:hypothetical protein SEVIR_4G038800v4 [Setaria viridis]|uniref:Uncharacterized protein n=1 Tax=Setaria viridis TaxID=4556 RepID=A0A4U6UT80_SETVI|nr:uncharacterized protein LOC117851967 [Setaria viridis]TKW19720.1 hypothetical protein SEVIR_4G038800v2 [Setaria viridis]